MTPGSAAPPWQPQQQPPRPASASLPTQASTSQLRSLPTGSDSARDAAAQSAGGSGSGSGGSALPARPGASGSTNALHGKVFTQEHTQQLLQNAAQLIAAAQQLQKQRMIQGHSQPPHQPQQQQPIGHSAQPQFAGTMASQPGAATGIPMHQYHQQYQQQGYGGIKRKADAVLGQPAGDAVLGMPMDGGGPSSLAAAAPPPPPLQPAAAAALHHFASEDIGTSQAGPPAVLHQLDFAQYMEGGGFSAGEGDGDGEDGSGDSDAQGNKKARLVWTQELHNRFINALSHLVRPCGASPWRVALCCFVGTLMVIRCTELFAVRTLCVCVGSAASPITELIPHTFDTLLLFHRLTLCLLLRWYYVVCRA